VLLADQDRSLWRTESIREGVELVGEALRRTPERPDPYAMQAAIAACHAIAIDYASTDWDAIISWYDVLLSIQESPTARLGRAGAVGERDGAKAGLLEIDSIDGLDGYPWWHASRAELLMRLGRLDESEAASRRALALGLNDAHARFVGRMRPVS
jgi:RNA polymerase sigma-70 factor (ECF subfamily)